MKARAAVMYEYNAPLVVEEVEVDGPREGEVLVKLAASGVCHSNYHEIAGRHADIKPPMILGDEGAGTVMEVGAEVKSVKPGDHVVLSWSPQCGQCFNCQRGMQEMCQNATSRSPFSNKDGVALGNYYHVSSFAEYTVVPEAGAIPIRKDVSLVTATLTGCAVPTGWGAVVNTAAVQAGESVAIIGLGGIGLSAVMGAVTAGAGPIIGVDINDKKLEMSKDFGVTDTVNSAKEDAVERIRRLTDGRGVDFAFDTIGKPVVTATAFAATRGAGTTVIVGIGADGDQLTVPFASFGPQRVLKGSVYGSINPPLHIPRLIELYAAGKLDLDRLITRRFTLDQINEAFDALITGDEARCMIVY